MYRLKSIPLHLGIQVKMWMVVHLSVFFIYFIVFFFNFILKTGSLLPHLKCTDFVLVGSWLQRPTHLKTLLLLCRKRLVCSSVRKHCTLWWKSAPLLSELQNFTCSEVISSQHCLDREGFSAAAAPNDALCNTAVSDRCRPSVFTHLLVKLCHKTRFNSLFLRLRKK